MDYAKFSDSLRRAAARYDSATLEMDPPATPKEVAEAEAALGRPLPAALKDFFLHCSKRIDFDARLTDEQKSALQEREIYNMRPRFKVVLAEAAPMVDYHRDLTDEGYYDYEELEDEEQRLMFDSWHNCLACILAGSADFYAFDDDGTVRYLNGDGDEKSGYVLARDFHDLLERLQKLGFCAFDLYGLTYFLNTPDGGLEAEGETAEFVRKTLGI